MRHIGTDGNKKKVGFTNQYPRKKKRIQVDFFKVDLSLPTLKTRKLEQTKQENTYRKKHIMRT